MKVLVTSVLTLCLLSRGGVHCKSKIVKRQAGDGGIVDIPTIPDGDNPDNNPAPATPAPTPVPTQAPNNNGGNFFPGGFGNFPGLGGLFNNFPNNGNAGGGLGGGFGNGGGFGGIGTDGFPPNIGGGFGGIGNFPTFAPNTGGNTNNDPFQNFPNTAGGFPNNNGGGGFPNNNGGGRFPNNNGGGGFPNNNGGGGFPNNNGGGGFPNNNGGGGFPNNNGGGGFPNNNGGGGFPNNNGGGGFPNNNGGGGFPNNNGGGGFPGGFPNFPNFPTFAPGNRPTFAPPNRPTFVPPNRPTFPTLAPSIGNRPTIPPINFPTLSPNGNQPTIPTSRCTVPLLRVPGEDAVSNTTLPANVAALIGQDLANNPQLDNVMKFLNNTNTGGQPDNNLPIDTSDLSCPYQRYQATVLQRYGGNCWILQPQQGQEPVYYVQCRCQECLLPRGTQQLPTSSCQPLYVRTPVFAYCENGLRDTNTKITRERIALPVACQCRHAGPVMTQASTGTGNQFPATTASPVPTGDSTPIVIGIR